jgi:feruloyl esterase
MKWPISVSCAAALAWAMSFQPLAASTPCEGLSSLSLPNATIIAVHTVAAGAFTPPGAVGNGEGFKKLPSFCRIAATLRPSNDSDIKIEVWLPVSGWNGKSSTTPTGSSARHREPDR